MDSDSNSKKPIDLRVSAISKKHKNISLPGDIPNVCIQEAEKDSNDEGIKTSKVNRTSTVHVMVHAKDNCWRNHEGWSPGVDADNGDAMSPCQPEEHDSCCPFHSKFQDNNYKDPRKRGYFSDTELENDDFINRPSNLLSFKNQSENNSIGSMSDESGGSFDQDSDYSTHILCLSDQTMERSTSNWLSHHQSTVGSLDNRPINCKMCLAEHCGGCRYNFRFAKTRLSGGAQLQNWLSVPNVGQKRPSILRNVSNHPKVPNSDTTDQPRKFTRSQKLTLISIGLVNLFSFLSMSIIAPFFPKEASKKGMREAVSGFVFSVYALVMMIASPLFGKMLQHTGTRFMYMSGIFVSGCSNILFGVLDKVYDGTTFTILCFTVRSFEAIGAAAFSTASSTIILDMFPDDVGTVFGVMETCVGIGMSLGPAVGGWLYAVGGYELPFFVLGASVLITIPLSWFMLGKTSAQVPTSCKKASYKNLLSIPLVMVVCVVVVVASQAQGFIDPTLEPHLRQYNLGTGIVGLLFLLTSAAYALFSPLVGYLTGNWDIKYPMMLFGLLVMTVSLLLLGPSPILPLPGGVLWLNILGIVLLGFSFACSFIPTFEAILNAALDAGLSDDLGTYSIVSGLWNAMCSLGEVTGPSLGGLLSDFLDFPLAATAMAIFSFLSAIMVLLCWLFLGKGCKRNVEKEADSGISDESIVQNEKTGLLSNREVIYGTTSDRIYLDDPSV